MKSDGRRRARAALKRRSTATPKTLDSFSPPHSLFTPPTAAGERATAEHATAVGGTERLASEEEGGGTTELRSPELHAARARSFVERCSMVP